MSVLNIILAILLFGFLIFIHEAGHFLFARLFKVTVNEFAIGMGPKLLSKKSKKSGIVYSLRAFPIGGFVSMAGEDEVSDDPNAFNKKPVWQRFIITVAGAATNLLVGALVMAMLVVASPKLYTTRVLDFFPELPKTDISSVEKGHYDGIDHFFRSSVSKDFGLEKGDLITKVNNKRVYIYEQLSYQVMRLGTSPVDLTVIRDGKEIVIEDVQFEKFSSQGAVFGLLDFYTAPEESKDLLTVAKHSVLRASHTVVMIWESLYDLVSGRYGMEAVSGPVGVTQALSEAADEGAYSFTYLAVVISMNLGVMNLLPLPALDGGRIVFLLIEAVRRKPVKQEIEAYINFAGIVALMLLMVLVCIKDVFSFF
ncbi:MAG: RIP metalloprotease RseP [Ruminococcaceae bacterium]|nr:RIP metalloprotease RseP [Oscillospiraceae bacterium]